MKKAKLNINFKFGSFIALITLIVLLILLIFPQKKKK